jgi:hypothetical protein
MEKYAGLRIKCEDPSRWTLIFERQGDGSIEIALAFGDNTPKQGVTLTADDASAFLALLGGAA